MWVEWIDDAQEELWTIIDYIDDYNSQAALQLYGDIVAAAEALPSYPYIHRQGRVLSTREMVVHPNYIVIYRVSDRIEILSVLLCKVGVSLEQMHNMRLACECGR